MAKLGDLIFFSVQFAQFPFDIDMAHNGVPGHDHSLCNPDNGECFSLYSHINVDQLVCFNEKENYSIRRVFKPFDMKADKSDVVESEADPQLIIHIPFHGEVKLKSFIIVGGGGGSCPRRLKMFINNDHIDFENVESLKPTQEWVLAEGDANGELEYPTQVSRFGNCRSITMLISDNYGADTTRIHFIGLKGEFTAFNRKPVIAQYELVPAASKGKTMSEFGPAQSIS